MGQDQVRLLGEVTSYDDDPKTGGGGGGPRAASSSYSSWADQMYLRVPPGAGGRSGSPAAPKLADVTTILAILRKENYPPDLHKIAPPGTHHWAAGEHNIAHPDQGTSFLTVDEVGASIVAAVDYFLGNDSAEQVLRQANSYVHPVAALSFLVKSGKFKSARTLVEFGVPLPRARPDDPLDVSASVMIAACRCPGTETECILLSEENRATCMEEIFSIDEDAGGLPDTRRSALQRKVLPLSKTEKQKNNNGKKQTQQIQDTPCHLCLAKSSPRFQCVAAIIDREMQTVGTSDTELQHQIRVALHAACVSERWDLALLLTKGIERARMRAAKNIKKTQQHALDARVTVGQTDQKSTTAEETANGEGKGGKDNVSKQENAGAQGEEEKEAAPMDPGALAAAAAAAREAAAQAALAALDAEGMGVATLLGMACGRRDGNKRMRLVRERATSARAAAVATALRICKSIVGALENPDTDPSAARVRNFALKDRDIAKAVARERCEAVIATAAYHIDGMAGLRHAFAKYFVQEYTAAYRARILADDDDGLDEKQLNKKAVKFQRKLWNSVDPFTGFAPVHQAARWGDADMLWFLSGDMNANFAVTVSSNRVNNRTAGGGTATKSSAGDLSKLAASAQDDGILDDGQLYNPIKHGNTAADIATHFAQVECFESLGIQPTADEVVVETSKVTMSLEPKDSFVADEHMLLVQRIAGSMNKNPKEIGFVDLVTQHKMNKKGAIKSSTRILAVDNEHGQCIISHAHQFPIFFLSFLRYLLRNLTLFLFLDFVQSLPFSRPNPVASRRFPRLWPARP